MKFKFTDPDLPELIEYFMVEGATKLSQKIGGDITTIWPEMFDKDSSNNDEKEWELQVMLNGKELPAREVFEHIDSQIEEMVEKKALEIINDRFSDLEELLYGIREDIMERVRLSFSDSKNDEEEKYIGSWD
jgi:hypothetical protein